MTTKQDTKWLLTDHSMTAIKSTTIGAAIDHLTAYADASAVAAARKLADDISDMIRPDAKLSQVTLAALIFAKNCMGNLSDSIAAQDAEIGARDRRRKAA